MGRMTHDSQAWTLFPCSSSGNKPTDLAVRAMFAAYLTSLLERGLYPSSSTVSGDLSNFFAKVWAALLCLLRLFLLTLSRSRLDGHRLGGVTRWRGMMAGGGRGTTSSL